MIELVVVLATVTLLVALMIPAASGARGRARTTRGLTNLQQIGQAIHAYTNDDLGTLPIGYHQQSPGTIPDTDWSILINSHMTGSGDSYASFPGGDPQTLAVFRDPNASFPNDGFLHYSSHPVLMPDTAHIDDPAVGWTRYRLSRMRRPSSVVLIMDATQNPAHPTHAYTSFATAKNIDNGSLHPTEGDPLYVHYEPTDTATNDSPLHPGANDDTVANTGNIRWRQHGNSAANFLFPDGHSQTIKMGQLHKHQIRVDP